MDNCLQNFPLPYRTEARNTFYLQTTKRDSDKVDVTQLKTNNSLHK